MAGSVDGAMIDQLLNSVLATVKGALPRLKACEIHGGRFDVAELKRMATQAPGVYLAVLGLPNNQATGDSRRTITVQLTAFVVARDLPKISRDRAALHMVQTLMALIPQNNWGLGPGGGMAYQVTASNLYSGALDKTRSALWGISWRQDITIGEDMWAGGVLPEALYAAIEPATGADHINDYEQLA